MTEEWAANCLLIAIKNKQAAELLNCLFEGGGFTFDLETQRLVMISAEEIEKAAGR